MRYESQVGNAFAKNIANWQGREMAYPTNVLHLATETANKRHSAAFPLALPQWFIKLFSDPGDLVLDPFAGSGTTLEAAIGLDRRSIGIEINAEFIVLCQNKLSPEQPSLLPMEGVYVTD